MDKPFAQSGSIWRLYGFTKTHFWGASITSTIFGVLGILLAAYAVEAPKEEQVKALVFALCSLLVGCFTILFSIMMLMFYLGSTLIRKDHKDVEQLHAPKTVVTKA
jgi:tellurite resistance protein TehA-like permease